MSRWASTISTLLEAKYSSAILWLQCDMNHSSSEQYNISFNYQLIYMELCLAETIIWSLHGAVTLRQPTATRCPRAISRLNTKLQYSMSQIFSRFLPWRRRYKRSLKRRSCIPNWFGYSPENINCETVKSCRITIAQVTTEFLALMNPECSLQYSQQPTNMSWPESHESIARF
jgi:hypothetical protein